MHIAVSHARVTKRRQTLRQIKLLRQLVEGEIDFPRGAASKNSGVEIPVKHSFGKQI